MTKVGIIGASGFAGAELLRLCAAHPELEVVVATGESNGGSAIAELYPSLSAAYPASRFQPWDDSSSEGLEMVFCALPHGASQKVVPRLLERGVHHVVDLGADFRLRDEALYPTWYHETHNAPDLLTEAVYGLPELFRPQLAGARLVAAPGCYATAGTLALAPLLQAGLVEARGIVVDAASGVSGAGRPPTATTTFCAVDEDFTAYGLLTHRHTPEMEQCLATVAGETVELLFTPHLAPMNRGILATCYARPTRQVTTADVRAELHRAYDDEPFIVVRDTPPSTKATLGSNVAHVTAYADERTGWVVCLAALDNLVKGASGQAVQCANLALGLPETTGLPTVGLYP